MTDEDSAVASEIAKKHELNEGELVLYLRAVCEFLGEGSASDWRKTIAEIQRHPQVKAAILAFAEKHMLR